MELVGLDYVNDEQNALVQEFINSNEIQKYILGINKYSKCVEKEVLVTGRIDDFTRVQSAKKKDVIDLATVPKDAIILNTASGSPLSVIKRLDEWGYRHISYLSLFRYSFLDLVEPEFMTDFRLDFMMNEKEYEWLYSKLADEKSKEIFTKLLNFKMSYDYSFMEGFTNNHDEQYFDKELIPNIEDITFVDGGAYVGDTLPNIIKNFSDFKKIYAIEPNSKHLEIAKRDFGESKNIEFINVGLGSRRVEAQEVAKEQTHGEHDYQAQNLDALDNLISEKVDFIKLDIEGAEQDALLGAQRLIKEHHPILAVCIYHQAEDWYRVPQIVLEMREDYDIYLRHYMEGIYETVLYFLPR